MRVSVCSRVYEMLSGIAASLFLDVLRATRSKYCIFSEEGVARDGTYSNCPSDSVSCRSSSQLFNFNAKLECTIFSPSNRRMSPHVPPKSEILRSKSEKQRAHEQPSSHAE